MSLTPMGQIKYGTVTFGVTSRSRINSTPIWDEAHRTIVAVEHTLHVKGYIVPGSGESNTDTQMATAHVQLETPGLELHYDSGMGWGGLAVNVPGGTVRDVRYGPHPKLLFFAPLGGGSAGNQAALVEWTCSTILPSCTNSNYAGQLMAYNADWSHEIDGSTGLSSILVTGYIEIPVTRRAGSREIPDDADKYRHLLQVNPPEGFKMEHDSFKLSKDKRRLDFSFKYQELPYPLPLGMTAANGRHDVEWSINEAATSSNTISGTVVVAPGRYTGEALDRWKQIVAARIAKTRAEIAKLPLVDGRKPVTILLQNVRISEELFTRSYHFMTRYLVIGAQLKDILKFNGMFLDFLGHDANAWNESIKKVWNVRGPKEIAFDSKTDSIIDLCLSPRNVSMLKTRTGSELRTIERPKAVPAELRVLGENFGKEKVPAEGSWITYVCRTVFHEDDRVIRHKPLTSNVQPGQPQSTNKPSNPQFAFKDDPPAHAITQSPIPDTLQRVGSPSDTVWLVGGAIRAGHRIPTPELVSVGGVKVTQQHLWSDETVASVCGGVPIYLRKWRIQYALPQTPRGPLPVMTNPALQTDGEAI